MLLRQIGHVFRGKATRTQVMLAAVLGCVLGFVFAPYQAPGLVLILTAAAFVLNANLTLFGLSLLLGTALSVVLLPVSFAVGRLLLDGPTTGLFAGLINAPVFAWFGLQYYAISGGLVLGLVFGGVLGVATWRTIVMLRSKFAGLEASSERFQRLTSKRWFKLFAWVFLGKGHGKATYAEMLEREGGGSPVRIAGVAVVAVAAIGLWITQSMIGSSMFRSAAVAGLERWNGATVDLAAATLDLDAGDLALEGLAIVDAEALDRDAFRARELRLELDTGSLLRRRLVIDELTSADASTGAKRAVPGKPVFEDAAAEVPAPPPAKPDENSKTLDDYLKEAEQWQQRLVRVSGWLEALAGSNRESDEAAIEREIERSIEAVGRSRVAADHLVDDSPLLLIRRLKLDGLHAEAFGDDLLDVRAENLSTNPNLVDEPVALSVRSRSDELEFTFAGGAGSTAQTTFVCRGLSIDRVMSELAFDEAAPLRGGTLDVRLEGELDLASGVRIDNVLKVTLHDTTMVVADFPETVVDELTLPLGVRGPLAAPRITFDDAAFIDALVEAGQAELAAYLEQRAEALADEHLRWATDELNQAVGGEVKLDKVADQAEQVADETKQKATDAAKREAENAADKLRGLFGKPIK